MVPPEHGRGFEVAWFQSPLSFERRPVGPGERKLAQLRPQVGLIGCTAQTTQALASGEFWVAIAGEFVQAGLFMDGHPYLAAFLRKAAWTGIRR